MNNLTIREAFPADSTELSALVIRAAEECRNIDFTESGWARFVESNSAMEMLKRIEDKKFRILCSIEGGVLTGVISIRENCRIDKLFVNPDFRGMGLSSKLWHSVKTICLKENRNGFFHVRSSTKAVPVYRRFGFEETGPAETIYGIRFTPMAMSVQ